MSAAALPKPFPPGMPVERGDVIAGKYRVDEMVAVGGMGLVVSARHQQLGQQVAIKVLLPTEVDDEEAQAVPRFLREARAAAALRSDHVVRIYDVDTLPSGLPYMVMELLMGQDLRRLVKTLGPLPVEQAVDYVMQAADAIGEAHASGIVHRDLKPSNLFLTTRTDGRPWVKVLDFGISKASHELALEGTLTTTRAMIGSPMYMSPEQIRDAKSVDGRSDIWSLGVILHELLSGKPAFRGESLPAICAAIAADPPASLLAARPDLPPELAEVVFTCLEKDPEARFQSVDELKQALLPFLAPYSATIPAPSGATAAAQRPTTLGGGSRGRVPLGSSDSIDVDPRLVGSRSRASKSGARVEDPTRNLLEASGEAETLHFRSVDRTAPAGLAPATTGGELLPERRRSALPFVLGGLAFVILVALVVASYALLRGTPNTAVASSAPPPRVQSFRLTLESEPPGADVLEGERVLGATPLTVVVQRDSVVSGPRVFSLELKGFKSHRLEQGDSEADQRVRATLEKLAVAQAPSSAPTPTKPATGAPRGAAKPSTQKPPPDTAPTKPGTDIRLSR